MATFHYFALLAVLLSAISPSGDSSALLNVFLKNDVVQKGQAIEIQIDRFLPDVKDKRFNSLECGSVQRVETLVPFVKWVKELNSFSILTMSNYTERITTTANNTIMIKNATLLDEGLRFYCKLSFVHSNGSQHIPKEIVKYVKLKKVYENRKPKQKLRDDKSLSGGTISAIIAGVILMVLIIIDFCCCLWKKQGLIHSCFLKFCGQLEKGEFHFITGSNSNDLQENS